MLYTLATLKTAVIEAAKVDTHVALAGKVTDRSSFIKAVRAHYPDKKWDFRTWDAWVKMANWVGVDVQPWLYARDGRIDRSPKLADVRVMVLRHYECLNSRGLKQKLFEWGISHGDLRCKASWQTLWSDVSGSLKQVATAA